MQVHTARRIFLQTYKTTHVTLIDRKGRLLTGALPQWEWPPSKCFLQSCCEPLRSDLMLEHQMLPGSSGTLMHTALDLSLKGKKQMFPTLLCGVNSKAPSQSSSYSRCQAKTLADWPIALYHMDTWGRCFFVKRVAKYKCLNCCRTPPL